MGYLTKFWNIVWKENSLDGKGWFILLVITVIITAMGSII